MASHPDMPSALRHLKRVDAHFGPLVKAHGVCVLAEEKRFDPFAVLLSAICHQQLHGVAAKTILGRLHAKFGTRAAAFEPARLDALKKCGLSTAKALAVKDLAAKVRDGTVPTRAALLKLSDDEIIDRLTEVRGIGPWTVQMMLMFRMGRLDVMPVDDFGVRKGFSRLHGHEEMVKPRALLEYAERWRPYRSVAAWYMWRVLDGPVAPSAGKA